MCIKKLHCLILVNFFFVYIVKIYKLTYVYNSIFILTSQRKKNDIVNNDNTRNSSITLFNHSNTLDFF
jgi:hypothetical protein